MKRSFAAIGLAFVVPALAACGGAQPAPPSPPPPPPAAPSATQAAVPADPMSPRPVPPPPPAFIPPSPAVFAGVSGITVWLLERHQVPLVSCDLTIPTGASSDPKDKAGLAYTTANMLDEGGAGKLGAIDVSRQLDDIGAHLGTDANADASFVSLTVLKRNLDKAF
ncbi:MAG TPA: hypothetical protein VHV30_14520, partial [Polyangiaceae bacterium]|nr:hypothetical protein [Polyangiaceae bacterium]